jgi:hypothetical protein
MAVDAPVAHSAWRGEELAPVQPIHPAGGDEEVAA